MLPSVQFYPFAVTSLWTLGQFIYTLIVCLYFCIVHIRSLGTQTVHDVFTLNPSDVYILQSGRTQSIYQLVEIHDFEAALRNYEYSYIGALFQLSVFLVWVGCYLQALLLPPSIKTVGHELFKCAESDVKHQQF